MMPLYGFLEGDSLGILVLADERETMASLADKLQRSAMVRVAARTAVHVELAGHRVHPSLTVERSGLTALDRFDVREGK
jgi:toluene-4-monooxygenase system protein B